MTPPQSKPPPDVLTRLITRLERQLARRRKPTAQREAASERERPAARDLDAYLSQRIEKALAPLNSLLDENDIGFIAAMLHERLATDPNLTQLVRRLARAFSNDIKR